MSPELEYTYLVDSVDRVRSRPGLSLTQDLQEQFQRLMAEEPELGRALTEMTKYRPSKDEFNFGASEVYFAIKKALESKELGKKFNLDT